MKQTNGNSKRRKQQEERSILINFVLDKSGSMEGIREATISGFNEFLGDQQREGGKALMTLTLFDTEFHTVASAVRVGEMVPLDRTTFAPGGMTALYDAIGHTLRITDDFVAQHAPDQVLFVVMTDGHENSSREFNQQRIFELIADRQREAGYEFLYLGANQDSYAVGTSMGVKGDRTMTYASTHEDAQRTMKRVSHNVSAYRRMGDAQMVDGAFYSTDFEKMGSADYQDYKRKNEGKDGEEKQAQ